MNLVQRKIPHIAYLYWNRNEYKQNPSKLSRVCQIFSDVKK